jgi:MYXO-CTERM domain-containing protein
MLASGAFVGGCSDGEPLGEAQSALAHPGPWEIPPTTLAIGDGWYVEYTSAGPWLGESGCSGGITSGTDILRDYIYAHFAQTYEIGGYACRPIVGNESQMSVHGTGRALDIMLPLDAGEADNDLGDPIGNWLIENAEAIGIQYIIWDLYTWMAERTPGAKGKDYGGTHPHHDHLHVELSVEMSNQTTNWFEDAVDPPELEGCAPLPSKGGIIEQTDDCFIAFGPAEYWRAVPDDGHGGSLMWTNAFESADPSNWARWNLLISSRGTYTVEVYVDPDWGVHHQTQYVIKHAEGETEVIVDQSTQHEWVNLGEFVFEAGAENHVSVYDNMPGAVAADQHIAVDALQVTRKDGYIPPPNNGEGDGAVEDDEEGGGIPDAEEEGGCTMSTGAASTGHHRWWSLLLLGALLWRRRSPKRR